MRKPFATLTVIASACLTMTSIPALAIDSGAVPSAIDSSKRVIRLPKSTQQQSPSYPIPNQQIPTRSTQQISNQPNPNTYNSNQYSNSTYSNSQVPAIANGNQTNIDLSRTSLPNIPTPRVSVSNVSFVDTIFIPQMRGSTANQLDVSLLDDFIKDVSPNVRHYPPNFPNRSQLYNTTENIKTYVDWITPYAEAPNASYDVLIRAAQLNGMGRNLNLGSDYTVRASNYVARALEQQPNSTEANLLYGIMLSEGGGFKESQKYLNKAASLGSAEAEQSLAQAELLSDRRDQALNRLRQLRSQLPNDSILEQQIQLVENGKYYIWDIPAPDINVKPVS